MIKRSALVQWCDITSGEKNNNLEVMSCHSRNIGFIIEFLFLVQWDATSRDFSSPGSDISLIVPPCVHASHLPLYVSHWLATLTPLYVSY